MTEKLLDLKSLSGFENWVNEHEKMVSDYLGETKVKDRLFPDYWGAVKSLGAWGGDMVLVSSDKTQKETEDYFASKGYSKLIPFKDLVL